MKPRLATCALTGCFGCHMSLLDIDDRILELIDLVDLDRSPFDDKKEFDGPVDIGLVEGGCSNEYNVLELRDFRAQRIEGSCELLRHGPERQECRVQFGATGIDQVELGGSHEPGRSNFCASLVFVQGINRLRRRRSAAAEHRQ